MQGCTRVFHKTPFKMENFAALTGHTTNTGLLHEVSMRYLHQKDNQTHEQIHFSEDRISLCIDLALLKSHRDTPASASQVLGLNVYTTTAQL